MTAPDRDPLTPEEHALAQRLQRLGGPDGPRAATDASILAAARAAATLANPPRAHGRRLRAARWPGGAITAVGTAAAFAIAIGTAWQLRPVDRLPAHAPLQGDDGVVEVELLGPRDDRAPPSDAAGPGASSDERDRARPSFDAAKVRAGPGVQDPAGAASAHAPDRASSASGRAAAAASTSPRLQPGAATATAGTPEPAIVTPVTPHSAAASTPDAARAGTSVDAGAPQEDVRPGARDDLPRRATYTTAARARAEARHDRATAHDRTGTREAARAEPAIAPVDVDARLAPAAWLERIRARRDAGDMEGARASLRRFEQAHPRLRLPRDLRALRDSAR